VRHTETYQEGQLNAADRRDVKGDRSPVVCPRSLTRASSGTGVVSLAMQIRLVRERMDDWWSGPGYTGSCEN